MNAPVSENISAAKAGGLIVLLLAGWLAYQTLSGPAMTPAASSKEITPPPSSLVRAGLRDYTDWEGLPEIFAVWADNAQWKNGRTRFAYWHPVMKTYSYYFEAVRVDGGYCFKEIAEPNEPDHFWDEDMGDDCPIRFYRSFPDVVVHGPGSVSVDPFDSDRPKVKLDVMAPKLSGPEATVPPQTPAPKP